MNYTIIVQVEALQDLREAWTYYEGQQNGLGQKFILAFREESLRIEKNPLIFQKIYNDKRRAVIKQFNYNIIYQVEESIVRISAVIHGSRHPKHWQD